MSAVRTAPFIYASVLGNPIFSQVSSQELSRDGKKAFMYFVIPPGQSKSSVKDKSLGEMFRTAEAHFLNVQWIKDENCADQVLEGHGNIFVFETFDSEGFLHWEKHTKEPFRVDILGPQVLRYVFNSPETITFQTKSCPTFTLAMRNMIVTLSGIKDKNTKDEVEQLVRYMNGTVSTSLTKAVTHVIAAKTITPKCLGANKHIPLMKPDWVREVWKSNQDFKVNASDSRFLKYKCPMFYNVQICLSQLPPNKKSDLKSTIELLGGNVSPDLVKGTTDVLVVLKAEGDKYKFARKWKITCVTPQWVENSKEIGHLLPLEDYPVTSVAVLNFISTPVHSYLNTIPDFKDTMCSEIMEDTAGPSRAIVTETDESTAVQRRTDYYLNGCKTYLVDSEKRNGLKELLNASRTVRLDTLVDGITHVIVPGQKLPKIVKDKAEALDPLPYTIQWLLESANQGRPADEDVFKFEGHGSNASVLAPEILIQPPPPPSDNENSFTTADPPQLEVSIAARNEQTDDTGTTLGTNDEVEEVCGSDESTVIIEMEESDDEDSGTQLGYSEIFDDEKDVEPVKWGLFNGISFKILISDAEERTHLRKTVLKNGGKLRRLDPTVIILDPVCRINYKLSAEKAHTKYWLLKCLETKNLDCDHPFLYFPCPQFRNMNLILKDVVIAISQYNVSEREYLVELVRALGGTYQDVFAKKDATDGKNRRSTHLICKNMDTDKAKAARKWGVTVVVAEWILECFVEKRRVEEAKYDPTVQQSSSWNRKMLFPTSQRRESTKQIPVKFGQMDFTNDTNNQGVFPPTAQKAKPVPTDIGTVSIAEQPRETSKNMSPVQRQSENNWPVLAQHSENEDEIEKSHLPIDQEEVATEKEAPARSLIVEQEPEPEIDENDQVGRLVGRPKKGSSILKPQQVITRRTRSRIRTLTEDNVPTEEEPVEEKDPTTFPFELPRKPIFMVSSVNADMKTSIGKLVKDLGGRLSSVTTYDAKADALITGSLVRSEKVLGCIAAAKFLLKPWYIFKCKNAGRFLPIDEESLWHERSINQMKELELARASFKWLQAQIKDSNKRSMSGMKFFLIDQPQDKLQAYHRLIHAAGGEVVADIRQATTVIKEDNNTAKVPPGVVVKNAMHLNCIVVMGPQT